MIVLVYGTATGYSAVMKYDIVLVHGKFLLRFCAPRAKFFARGARADPKYKYDHARVARACGKVLRVARARLIFCARHTSGFTWYPKYTKQS